jgi:hypothetical protein
MNLSAEVAGVLGGLIGGAFALLGVWLGPIAQRRAKKKNTCATDCPT